jgi:hypothetical protein
VRVEHERRRRRRRRRRSVAASRLRLLPQLVRMARWVRKGA